jgi:Lipid A core - O-antigen ligase and related enzymes
MLAIVAISHVQQIWLRWLLGIVLVVFNHLDFLFHDSRSNLVSSLMAVTLMVLIYLVWMVRISHWARIILFLIILAGSIIGISRWADPNGVKSIVSPQELYQYYQEAKELVRKNQEYFVQQDIMPQLYADNRDVQISAEIQRQQHSLQKRLQYMKAMEKEEKQQYRQNIPAVSDNVKPSKEVDVSQGVKALQAILPSQDVKPMVDNSIKVRSLKGAYTNMLFRIFIWQDMFEEIISQRKWFGVGFGQPQRSRTLEILHWGNSEWERDGWIAPHNSCFHIIYRAGIVGIILIAVFLWVLWGIVYRFISTRSLTGLCLFGIIVYWLVLSNFLGILELPYHAIIFWTIVGVTLAYSRLNQKI